MSKYDSLVKYICILDGDSFGSWVIDRENDGTLEHPIQMPYVSYSDMVHHFIDDIYDFIDHNKDMELNRYGDILNQNGLKMGKQVYEHRRCIESGCTVHHGIDHRSCPGRTIL